MNKLHFGIIASTLLATLGATANIARNDYQQLQQPPQSSREISSSALFEDKGDDWSALHDANHLFGNPTERPISQARQPKTLPKTQLKLVLSGTFTHHDSNKASALIGSNSRQSKRYRIGDTLPGGAELVAVHKGSVTLRREGQDELLQFARRKTSSNRPYSQTLSYNRQDGDDGWVPDDL